MQTTKAKPNKATAKAPEPKSLAIRFFQEMTNAEKNNFKKFCESIGTKGKTFYNWVNGTSTPNALARQAIAGYFKCTPNDIWTNQQIYREAVSHL